LTVASVFAGAVKTFCWVIPVLPFEVEFDPETELEPELASTPTVVRLDESLAAFDPETDPDDEEFVFVF
jgi:hypothetical protein